MNCVLHGVTKSQTQLSNFHFTSRCLLGITGQVRKAAGQALKSGVPEMSAGQKCKTERHRASDQWSLDGIFKGVGRRWEGQGKEILI